MPRTEKLILYLDTDYILPIAIDSDGKVHEFLDRRYPEGRVWLFFRSDGDKVSCNAQCRSDWYSGAPFTLGDFWNRVSRNEGGGNTVPEAHDMVAVLERAGILNDLTHFYSAATGSEVNIPVAYVFSDVIDLDTRKQFLQLMMGYGNWQLVSYSASPTLLMALKGCLGGLPDYGQLIVTSQLSDSTLSFNAFGTMNGTLVRVGRANVTVPSGDPERRTLVEIVVDTIEDKERQLRTADEREREIAYQMRHVDDWLAREASPSFTVPFSYRGTNKNYPVTVSCDKLKNARDERIRRLVGAIDNYLREQAPDNTLRQLLLLDDTLGSPIVCKRIERQINDNTDTSVNRVIHLNDRDRVAALSDYNRLYGGLDERLVDFDRNALLLERHDRDNAAMMANASVISHLHSLMNDLRNKVLPQQEAVNTRVQTALSTAVDLLRESRFDEAQQAITAVEELMQHATALEGRFTAIVNDINNSGQDVRRLIDLASNQQSDNPLIKELNGFCNEVRLAFEQIGERRRELSKTLDNIRHYRECHPRFKQLLERLHAAGSATEKRAIWQEIEQQRLTLEPCPIIELDRPIAARITARIDTVKQGGFLGFGGTKINTLHVELTITDSRPVPFASLLIVQDQPLMAIDRHGAHIEELPEQLVGTRSWEWQLPLPELGSAHELYIYYKPIETLDQNSLVRCDYVKLKIS